MKANEQKQVDLIIDFLKKGYQRKTILSNFVQFCPNVSEKTFQRRLKVAEGMFKEQMSKLNTLVEQKLNEDANVAKIEFLTVSERQAILAGQARGEIKVKKAVFTPKGIVYIEEEPNHADRRAAVAELNKMCGDYAPQKTESKVDINQLPLPTIEVKKDE
jgi:hypothetical protein